MFAITDRGSEQFHNHIQSLRSWTAPLGLRPAQPIKLKGKSFEISAARNKLNPPNGGKGTCCRALRRRHKRPLESGGGSVATAPTQRSGANLTGSFASHASLQRYKLHPAVASLPLQAEMEMRALKRISAQGDRRVTRLRTIDLPRRLVCRHGPKSNQTVAINAGKSNGRDL